MEYIKKEHWDFNKKSYGSFILGGDVGGTNTTLGIFGVKNSIKKKSPELLVSFHFKSKRLRDLYSAIKEVMDYMLANYKIKIGMCSLGIAGALSYKKDYVRLTNANLDFSKKISLKKLGLKKVVIMNDFEAVGYGINALGKNDICIIKHGKKIPKAPVLVIGAGTGLGKSLLIYNEGYGFYIPLHSEAHHSDFAAQNSFEMELANFIKKYRNIKQNVSNGDILSGHGLAGIYMFLRHKRRHSETKFTREIGKSDAKAELISQYRKSDRTCKEAFEIFKSAYARAAKNFALDGMALGGIYIAGGIAPKNREIFDKEFVRIFECNHKMADILREIPIYLILNCNVGLLGAGFAGCRFLKFG